MEEKLQIALKSEKLIKAKLTTVSEALRYCMLKVGIRSTNLPDELESMMLYNHLVEFYGKLTVEEIKLAFDLAVTGKIEAPETYENFSCSYLSKVLNAYKIWADDKFYKQNTPPPITDPAKQAIESNWRMSVQAALDKFYKGNYEYRLWVSDMYDQLVCDDFIHPAIYYKGFMNEARLFFCNKIQLEIIQVEAKIIHNPKFLSDHKVLENKLIEYRNGSRDKEVLLLSKQKAILKYFEYLKEKNITKIYEQN